MSSSSTARITFIIARESDRAVIFRRGPSQWTQMITWNLENDSLVYGQWLKKKVRPERCDLSPKGTYLIYLIDQLEHRESRTVISRPPYWTALSAWEHSDPLFDSGGGLFTAEYSVQLNWHHPLEAHEAWPVPPQLEVGYFKAPGEYNLWKGQINLLLDHRLERDGWKRCEDKVFVEQETMSLTNRKVQDAESGMAIEPQLWVKAITRNASLYKISFYHSEDRKTYNRFYVSKRNERSALKEVEWADIDHNGRILATMKGKLYASKRLADGSVQLENLQLLHDLNPQKPQYIKPPRQYHY